MLIDGIVKRYPTAMVELDTPYFIGKLKFYVWITLNDCRSLLGMVNFYRRYIPNCAQIIAPITDLTRRRAAEIVKWGDSQEWAFNDIKNLLSSERILKLPDLNKEFILQTDASNKVSEDVSSRNMMM